jgi:hypothetical protein
MQTGRVYRDSGMWWVEVSTGGKVQIADFAVATLAIGRDENCRCRFETRMYSWGRRVIRVELI